MQRAMKQQSGMVLFMSLVMLLMLTVLGISSVQTTSLQLRMARNATDSGMAFQAAEAGLRDAEDYIEALTAMTQFDLANSGDAGLYYDVDPGDHPHWKQLDWDGADGFREAETTITGVAVQPRYIVEHVKICLLYTSPSPRD